MDVHKMLEQVKAGQLDIAEAEAKLKDLPYEDLGYAKLDHHRKLRSGFGETIFCQGKPDPYLKEIFLKFYERDGEVLGTRASQAQYELIRSLVPAAVYDPISRIVKVEKPDKGACRLCGSMYRRHSRYPGGRGGSPDSGVFRNKGRPHL